MESVILLLLTIAEKDSLNLIFTKFKILKDKRKQ